MVVESTMLKEVEYRYRVLTVTFRNNTKYSYHKVPRVIYDKLVVAPSKGQYFNQNIKHNYTWSKLS